MFTTQRIHIIVEIVVFITLVFWIYSKEKSNAYRFKAILQKLEEQENRILKLEAALFSSTPTFVFTQPLQKEKNETTIEEVDTPETIITPEPEQEIEDSKSETDDKRLKDIEVTSNGESSEQS